MIGKVKKMNLICAKPYWTQHKGMDDLILDLICKTAPQNSATRHENSISVRPFVGALMAAAYGIFSVTNSMPAHAQITFSEQTTELQELERQVNDCAVQQEISSCFNALSRTHILQNSQVNSENSAESIMRNAVMFLPLYMLAELYERKGRQDVACGYAQSGKRQLHRLLIDVDALMAKDPLAFRNVDKTKRGLQEIEGRFDKVLSMCD